MTGMPWAISHRFDPPAVRLADRHYNRRKVGSPQFVPPGRNLVLLTPDADALWVTSWPFAEYVRHEWPGAWVNSVFRREGGPVASELITAAVAASLWRFGSAPALGIVTFIDTTKTRHKRDPGRCYRRAGWTHRGWTKGGLLCLGQHPADMPEPQAPMGTPGDLFTELWARDAVAGVVDQDPQESA